MPEDSNAFSIPSVFSWTEETEDSIKQAAETILPPTPPTETVEPAKTEIVAVDELDKLSDASKLAHSMKETNKWFSDDVEIPDNLDEEGLKKLIWEQTTKNTPEEYKVDVDQLKLEHEQKLRQVGLAEDQVQRVLEYSQHLANGGSQEVVSRSMNLDILSNSVLTTDDEKETVIRVSLQLEGNSPEAIEALIEKKYDSQEKLDAGADEAQAKLARIRDQEIAADAQRATLAKKASDEKKLAEKQMLEAAIDKGFPGIVLTAKESEDLKKFMFTADQVRDIDTPQGKARIVETAETKALRELATNPEKRAQLAYWLKYGMEGLVNQASKANMDKFMSSLGKKQQNVPTQEATPRREAAKVKDYYTTFPITG